MPKQTSCFSFLERLRNKRFVFFNEASEGYDGNEFFVAKRNRTEKKPENKIENSDDQKKEVLEKKDPEKESLEKQNKPPIPEYNKENEPNRKSATELVNEIKDLPLNEQIAVLKEEAKKGNVPSFMRKFKDITIEKKGISITLSVAPQYMAVGSDDDWVFIPMDGVDAMDIAQSFDCSLPTTQIVREIEKKADIIPFTDAKELGKTIIDPETGQTLFIKWAKAEKGEKYGLYEGKHMMSAAMWVASSKGVRDVMGSHPQDLSAGYKKDIVLHHKAINGLQVIYGAKHPNGKRVQGPSDFHEDTYPDYSQGARLVRNKIIIKEKKWDPKMKQYITVIKDPPLMYEEALANPKYAGILTGQVLSKEKNMYKKRLIPVTSNKTQKVSNSKTASGGFQK